jgi:EAL domain-containing protein (putative c-di-GMP-specific phosphodiesterase class I)
VISQAARRAARGICVVEANLSAASISKTDVLPFIERELRAAGVDPADLVFEITETALMKDMAAGGAFAHGLADWLRPGSGRLRQARRATVAIDAVPLPRRATP